MIEDKNTKSKVFEGANGKLLLEISKTFKGDQRFKMDSRFKDDVDIDKLPEKFKQIAEKEIMNEVKNKTKKIQKEKKLPLIIHRFQPGTESAKKIIKQAEGQRQFIESVVKAERKKHKKVEIKRGIDRVKRADLLLNKTQKPIAVKNPDFKIEVHGNRKEAFQPSHFQLFS